MNDDEIPLLEASFTDLTQENWAWAKVVDAYIHPEEGKNEKYLRKKCGTDCITQK